MTIDNTDIAFEDKIQLPTIRDQFAMAALATMDLDKHFEKFNSTLYSYDTLATQAYIIADAMLKARAK